MTQKGLQHPYFIHYVDVHINFIRWVYIGMVTSGYTLGIIHVYAELYGCTT